MTIAETVAAFEGSVPFAELDALTQGTVAVPGDEEYDGLVSPWNLAIPVRPAAVVAAETDQDVVEAVRFAAAHGLRVTPQATGHGPMAELVTELLVTTKHLDEVVVHPEGWARAGAGVKWLRVVEAAAPFGLAPLSGSITDVGIVGYTTGGGLGPMARTYGLAIDMVRAVEVVTGDGDPAPGHADGAPRAVLRPPRRQGDAGHRHGDRVRPRAPADVLRRLVVVRRRGRADRHRAVAVLVRRPSRARHHVLRAVPAAEDARSPPELAGRLTLSVRYVWTGEAEEGERRFAAMRGAAPVILDDVAHKPYTAIDSVHTDPLDPTPAYEAAAVLTDFPEQAVDALLALTGPGVPSPQVLVEVRQMGGAIARGGEHPSAFASREVAYSLLVVGISEIPGVEDHAAAILEAMRPWTGGYRLPNFTFTPEEYADAYDEVTIARLRRAIRTYDPDGVMAIGGVLA